MGNCGSNLDCSIFRVLASHNSTQAINEYKRTHSVEPDSAIVGIGVLVAFFASALFAFAAIIVAYFTDSLSQTSITKIDEILVHQWQSSSWVSWIYSKTHRLLSPFKWVLQKMHLIGETQVTLSKEDRANAIVQFVLTISDQQLVTGLAVLTAAMFRPCDFTLYELQVVQSLAWFSTMAHLITLSILGEYFHKNPEVLVWRTIGMSATLVLLFFATQVGGTSEYVAVTPLCCALHPAISYTDPFSQGSKYVILSFLCLSILNIFMQRVYALSCPARFWSEYKVTSPAGVPEGRWTFPASLKANLIKDTPSLAFIPEIPRSLILERLLWLSLRLNRSYTKLKGLDRDRLLYKSLIETDIKNRGDLYRLLYEKYQQKDNQIPILSLGSWFFFISNIEPAFASQIPFMCLELSYGIAQTIHVRGNVNSNKMDFGQIVPLLLLLLPVLAAAETYYDSRRHAGSGKQNSSLKGAHGVSRHVSTSKPEPHLRQRARSLPLDTSTSPIKNRLDVIETYEPSKLLYDWLFAIPKVKRLVWTLLILRCLLSTFIGALINFQTPLLVGVAITAGLYFYAGFVYWTCEAMAYLGPVRTLLKKHMRIEVDQQSTQSPKMTVARPTSGHIRRTNTPEQLDDEEAVQMATLQSSRRIAADESFESEHNSQAYGRGPLRTDTENDLGIVLPEHTLARSTAAPGHDARSSQREGASSGIADNRQLPGPQRRPTAG